MEDTVSVRAIIASNVRKYRKLNNLTQANLAEMAEVSNTYIANIECGQTWLSDKTLEKIASALHLDVYLLFVPEKASKRVDDDFERRKELLSYVDGRQKEFDSYVRNFFSETFEHILQKM